MTGDYKVKGFGITGAKTFVQATGRGQKTAVADLLKVPLKGSKGVGTSRSA